MEASNDNWISWTGGACPVERGTRVDVRNKDGFVWPGVEALRHMATHDAYWRHACHSNHNITAYRVAS